MELAYQQLQKGDAWERPDRILADRVRRVKELVEGLVNFVRLSVWIQAIELIIKSCVSKSDFGLKIGATDLPT